MFRPPSLFASRVAPTAASSLAGQLRRLHPSRTCIVTFSRIGYAIRPQHLLCKQAEIHSKLLLWLRFRVSDPAKCVPKMFLQPASAKPSFVGSNPTRASISEGFISRPSKAHVRLPLRILACYAAIQVAILLLIKRGHTKMKLAICTRGLQHPMLAKNL